MEETTLARPRQTALALDKTQQIYEKIGAVPRKLSAELQLVEVSFFFLSIFFLVIIFFLLYLFLVKDAFIHSTETRLKATYMVHGPSFFTKATYNFFFGIFYMHIPIFLYTHTLKQLNLKISKYPHFFLLLCNIAKLLVLHICVKLLVPQLKAMADR